MNIYVEKQKKQLYVVHTTNSLLGSRVYSATSYRSKVNEVVPGAQEIPGNMDPDPDVGNYSMWILHKILATHNICKSGRQYGIAKFPRDSDMETVITDLVANLNTTMPNPVKGVIITPGHVAAIHFVNNKWLLADSERNKIVDLSHIKIQDIRHKKITFSDSVIIQFLKTSASKSATPSPPETIVIESSGGANT